MNFGKRRLKAIYIFLMCYICRLNQFMEIRKSKSGLLSIARIVLVVLVVLLFQILYNLPESKSEWIASGILIFIFLLFIVYFFRQANDKNPVYVFTENEIIFCDRKTSVRFSDLAYFRYEKVGYRTPLKVLFFYDAQRQRVCEIKINFMDKSPEEVIIFLENKLTRLRTPKGFY